MYKMFSPDYEKRLLYSRIPDAADRPSPSDRFIPSRANNKWQVKFSEAGKKEGETSNYFMQPETSKSASAKTAYNSLLKNVLLGEKLENVSMPVNGWDHSDRNHTKKGLFNYRVPVASPYLTTSQSQRLLQTTSNRSASKFKISPEPYAVLVTPNLQNDFYLNLLDYSATNLLAVGLKHDVYLVNGRDRPLANISPVGLNDANTITSVSWSRTGSRIAVGTGYGYVTIWDTTTLKRINKLIGHFARVGSLAWNSDSLSSGSADGTILQHDIRCDPLHARRKLEAHHKEVCGLKWSPDKQYLASGGDDHRLFVWDLRASKPVMSFTQHTSAVKAIAWSPHQYRLLSSGGGYGDHCIRHWNTQVGLATKCVDTGSPVCDLAWSQHSQELVSTHGYSENEIIIWKYPGMTPETKLTGHTERVLFLALSPDGETIATGSGDEMVAFWKVFEKTANAKNKERGKSQLALYRGMR